MSTAAWSVEHHRPEVVHGEGRRGRHRVAFTEGGAEAAVGGVDLGEAARRGRVAVAVGVKAFDQLQPARPGDRRGGAGLQAQDPPVVVRHPGSMPYP